VYAFAAQGTQAYAFASDSATLRQLFLLNLADPAFLGKDGLQHTKRILHEAASHFKLVADDEGLIIDRGSQLTLMTLGRNATSQAKDAYDANGGRVHRMQIADHLNAQFQECHLALFARPAGKSSINITPVGIDKAFGITKVAECLGVPSTNMIYIGDEFWPGGVDEPVIGRVLAAINVGPSVPPSSEQRIAISDTKLGPLGTIEVLNMIVRTQRGIKTKHGDLSIPVAA
jgi:hypothetical protein